MKKHTLLTEENQVVDTVPVTDQMFVLLPNGSVAAINPNVVSGRGASGRRFSPDEA